MDKKERYITDDLDDVETKELMDSLPNYFGGFGDIDRSAYLNWRFYPFQDLGSQFSQMAEAYFEVAILLIDECLKDNWSKKADIWIFPIMFNAIHGVETYLKAFNSLYRIHEELRNTGELQKSEIEDGHNIQQLCKNSISLLKKSNNNESNALINEFKFVQKFIEILYQNTNDMTFTRYPTKNKKQNHQNHFYIGSSKNVVISLDVFRQWVLRVFRILENLTGHIEYQVDTLKDMRSEYLSNIDY
ncbi:MAG: hypothetical protein FWG70_03915 [Oscillospiraceae bacterium]|nr:hypothetical protein [Oscillospiraceae bacterium]